MALLDLCGESVSRRILDTFLNIATLNVMDEVLEQIENLPDWSFTKARSRGFCVKHYYMLRERYRAIFEELALPPKKSKWYPGK